MRKNSKLILRNLKLIKKDCGSVGKCIELEVNGTLTQLN